MVNQTKPIKHILKTSKSEPKFNQSGFFSMITASFERIETLKLNLDDFRLYFNE